MVLQVNLLIYVYMALCVCLLIFNLIYIGRGKIGQKREPRKIQKYQEKLRQVLLDGKGAAVSEREKEKWMRTLASCSRLILFEQAIEGLQSEEPKLPVQEWMWNNRDIFWHLGSVYLEKKGMEPAFLAYIAEQYHLCGKEEKDPIALQMEQLVMSHSIYCRENALYALYSSGQVYHVARAYRILSRAGIMHSSKMVTDGLLAFRGDCEELAEELWKCWDVFSAYYQTCFVNFMRMIDGDFSKEVLEVLTDEENDSELHFAAIRYFRKHSYSKAYKKLCTFVEQWESEDWEYAAISALSLEAYPGERTIEVLAKGCESRSWYVRYNSALSLAKITDAEQKRDLLAKEKDPYASAMMKYCFANMEEKTG